MMTEEMPINILPDNAGDEKLCLSNSLQRTRNTQQRKAVLEAVIALAGKHPTAAEVFDTVRVRHPRMSLATVYRALHALVRQNSVCEIRIENVARYDAGPCPHHHVVCRHCGAVLDVCAEAMPESLAKLLHELESTTGYRLDPHPIQMSGLCRACRD
jgi:Fe2+ or Zn2+ uptake regulation protein